MKKTLQYFTFNCIKHHILHIAANVYACQYESDIMELSGELLQVGHSPLDLYIGRLSNEKIITEITQQLIHTNHFSKTDYQVWIQNNNGYHQVSLSDHSDWTLRFQENDYAYIHLHPSRNSLHVLRTNASTMKSAILYSAWRKTSDKDFFDIETVNELRKKYLSLPPIKKLSASFVKISEIIKKGNEINHCPV